MRIGAKITLFYTSITFGITLFIVLVFYIFTSRYINKLFDVNLCDKAYLTAQKHWEKDEMNIKSYQLIEQKYKALLPQAREVLLNCDSAKSLKDSLNKYLSPEQQKVIYNGEPIAFSKGGLCGAALYYPDNQGNFLVFVMAHNGYGYKIQQHTLLLSMILLLVSILITFMMGRLYSGKILEPLKSLLQNLKQIRGNNLNVKLNESGNKDELDDLIHTLNEMLDRINEAFKSEKSFVNSASHELNNPLTAIQGECEIILMKERSPQEYVESLERISTESKRLSQLIKHLLFLSRHDKELLSQELLPIELDEFLSELAQSNNRVIFSNLVVDHTSLVLNANPYLLRVAIQNFISNACKYSNDHVDLRLKVNNNIPCIEIEDYGIGIPKDELSGIFQSFYRASNTRSYSGTGIGLTLSCKILSIYKAEILVESEENVHTIFSISFPS